MVFVEVVMIEEKFRVNVGRLWMEDGPGYFDRFWTHCQHIARENGWAPMTVANHQLRPWGGRLITTKTQGWYLRWDEESSHTAFALRWA